MRIRTRLAITAATLAAAAVPGVAHAAPATVINFNDQTGSAPVGNAYQASSGVQFGRPSDFGLAGQFPATCSEGPGTIDGGISGRSLAIGCRGFGEIASWDYEAAISFNEERRGVSFNLRSLSGTNGPITVTLIRDNNTAIESRTINLPAGVVVPVSFTHATPDIDVVVLTARQRSSTEDTPIQLDDLSAPKDDVPPPPKFAVGLTEPSIDVPEAGTATTKIAIRRINGSTGPVTLAVPDLPGGIAAIKLDPNPATGTNPPVLSISASGPATGNRQLTITASGSASAGTNVTPPIAQTAHIVPALVMPESLAERSVGVVAGCPSTISPSIHVHGAFSGPIHLHVSVDSGPVVVNTPDVDATASGEGSLAFPITLSQPKGQPADSYLHLAFTPIGATPQAMTVRVNAGATNVPDVHYALSYGTSSGFGEQWLPEFTPGARDATGSNQIQIEGTFPAGCAYKFQDDLGQDLPIVKIERGRRINQEGEDGGEVLDLPDRAILQLPADARSTFAKETSGPFGSSSRITLRTFRNSDGLNGVNSGEGAGTDDFTWSDFLRTFGSDDGDWCTPFGCVRDPVALVAWHFISKKVESHNGLCFGWSTMALRFERGIDLPSEYQPKARYGFDIDHPEQESSAIKRQIVRWQAAQQDQGWQEYKDGLRDHVTSLSAFHDQLRDALKRDDAVTLALYKGSAGHAVDAYDMRDLGDGRFEIYTYNPNWPYQAAEETDKGTRDKYTRLNKIVVGPNSGAGGGAWSAFVDDDTTPWAGDMSDIEIYDHLPPSNADLPVNLQRWVIALENWVSSSGPDAPKVDAIKVDGKDALRADGTAKPGSGVSDEITPSGSGAGDIAYQLTKGKSYDLTIHGAAGGRYTEGLMGGGDVATVSSTRGAGEQDHVTVTPGTAQIGIAGGGASAPATIDLGTHLPGGISRAIEATLSSGAGRSDTLGLTADHAGVTVSHRGAPTSVALTVTSAGGGAPGSITTAPLRVGKGQRLVLRPAWRDLGAGATYSITDAHGRVVRSGHATLRASTKVRFARGLAARIRRGAGAKRQVTVTGKITKPGSSPLLVVTAQAVRGAKVLSTATVTRRGASAVKAGRFSVPVTLRKLPRGAKVKVTATLIDEAASFATARAATTAR